MLHSSRGEDGETWFGKLHLLFRYKTRFGVERESVFIRWLQQVPARTRAEKAMGMTRLKWATTRVNGRPQPHFDCCQVERLQGLVCIQEDLSSPGCFFHNRFIA